MKPKYVFIRPAVLLLAADNDDATFVHLLKTFLQIVPDMVKGMQEAALHKDAIEMRFQLHSLKNCLALLGAHDQSQALGILESRVREKDFEFNSVFFDLLVLHIQEVICEATDCLAGIKK